MSVAVYPLGGAVSSYSGVQYLVLLMIKTLGINSKKNLRIHGDILWVDGDL